MTASERTILIIDDSTEDREAYRRYLDNKLIGSCQIIEAESGEEGLERLASIQPDLILLDYLLPDCNGLEFIKELKRQTIQIPPIIMLTGQGNESIAVEVMKSGAKDYLIKGELTPEILTATVNKVIQQHNLQSRLTNNFQQQQLITETALRIHQSRDLSEILATAVQEVQLLLNCDRVVVYQFAPDMSGNIVAESVKPGWKKSWGQNIVDTCFKHGSIAGSAARYKRGESLAVDNIYQRGFSECHIKLLEQFQIKAHIVSPLLLPNSQLQQHDKLWGLLIVHQCKDIRHWEADEVELLSKLSVQLAIAIQQAELISSLTSELNKRKRLETELAQRVKILEASEDYIGLYDIEGRVLWNNPSMRKIVGVDDDANISQLSIADYHPQWALDIIKGTGISTAISRGTWLGETAMLTKDGREIPVSQLIIAHKSSDDRIEFFSTVIRNLSLQKKTENSLKEKAHELNWVNQELLKITSLLKKRNQELDRFAYVTSHDLKAPLRAIANLATWLSEDLSGQIPEENQHQLQLMQSRVQRMEGLIQGLLTYSRVGREKTSVETVNVRDLVNEVIDALEPPPEFDIFVAANMPTLKTQRLLLEQVFSNLISNAIKYHNQEKGKISISTVDLGEFYQFAVADDGLGIEPQYHDRIFTIFQTLQARDTVESTGIGLSIVKKIVEGQGGNIKVESQLGEGSTFYFTWQK